MRRGWLWVAALVLTLTAAAWQRRTGPSYPVRTEVALRDTAFRMTLPRTSPTTAAPRVTLPAAPGLAEATLRWRRYPTDDAFAAVPMRPVADRLVAALPIQPRAGKVEYYLELTTVAERLRIPDETVILRFRGPVPAPVLVAHIAVIFLAMLIGVRAAFAAACDTGEQRALTLLTLAGLTLGGLVLGPITQRYAFGAYWTGVPFGWDLTDNKTLVMWIGWLAAGIAAFRRHRTTRGAVLAAAVLMLTVYLIPHSMHGSQLDYDSLPAAGPGAPPQ
jgi:hypothetical protein